MGFHKTSCRWQWHFFFGVFFWSWKLGAGNSVFFFSSLDWMNEVEVMIFMMRGIFFVKLLRPQAFYKLSWSHWVRVSNGWAFRAPLSNFFEGSSKTTLGGCWMVSVGVHLEGQWVGSWLWHFHILEELETSTKVSCMITVKRQGCACGVATKSPLGGFRTKWLSVKWTWTQV